MIIISPLGSVKTFSSSISEPAGQLTHIPCTGNVHVSETSLNNYDNKLKNVMTGTQTDQKDYKSSSRRNHNMIPGISW
jgi:hypothetical protein